MKLTDQMKEIIYYMLDCAVTESDKSISINFYPDNVEVSIYPMVDTVGMAGTADAVGCDSVDNKATKNNMGKELDIYLYR